MTSIGTVADCCVIAPLLIPFGWGLVVSAVFLSLSGLSGILILSSFLRVGGGFVGALGTSGKLHTSFR